MTQITPSRRTVLRAASVTAVGVTAIGTLSERAVATLAGSSARAAVTTSSGCATLTPEETQGPFWVDERLNRSDVRADSTTGAVEDGIPLTLTITLLDAGGSCSPQAGAYVDIWHANAAGEYSDVSGQGNPDNRGVDWLRGYQVSDADGQVTFTTIYPGWYTGRTIHVHFRVRTSLTDGSEVNFTSQLFFDESVNNAVVATSDYQKSGTRTTNATDNIYDAALLMPVTGSTSAGYTGAFTVNLDFGDGTDGGTGGTGSSDTAVRARVSSARVVRRPRGRFVEVTLAREEKVAALVRLVRHDDVLASRRTSWLRRGSSTIRFRVPRGVDAGRARVVVLVADAASNTRIVRRSVRVPA